MFASSVSDYTKGGWEVHFIERGIGLNLHFHHWYYGIPLGLLAFALIWWPGPLAVERLYDRGLFRGATGINHYEGDMMVGNLVYNLVWLHALKHPSAIRMEANYFNR